MISCTRRCSVVPFLLIRDVLRIFSTSFTTWWSRTHVVVLFLRSVEPWHLCHLLDSAQSVPVVDSDHVEAWRLFRLLDEVYDWRSRTQIVTLCMSACRTLTSLAPSRFDWRCGYLAPSSSLWASDCWSEASLHFELSSTTWTTSSRHQTMTGHTVQVLPPYSLHPSHDMRIISVQCRIPVVEGDMIAVMIGRVWCPSMIRIKITAGV